MPTQPTVSLIAMTQFQVHDMSIAKGVRVL